MLWLLVQICDGARAGTGLGLFSCLTAQCHIIGWVVSANAVVQVSQKSELTREKSACGVAGARSTLPLCPARFYYIYYYILYIHIRFILSAIFEYMALAIGSMAFHRAHKTLEFQGPTPSHFLS